MSQPPIFFNDFKILFIVLHQKRKMSKHLKIILLCCFVFIFSKTIQAQTFEAGIIAGVNLSQLHGDGLAGFNQIGMNFGGRVAITTSEKWKWNIDILLSQKGSHKGADDRIAIPFDSFRLNYAEVPVMVSYLDWLSGDEEYYKLHFTGGISFCRLVKFKVIDNVGRDISDTQDFSKNAIDLIGGATYFINAHIGINAQFSYAILNVRKDRNEQSLQGRTLTFRGIYMF